MKKNETGIFQKENGNWYYRFTIMKDGKKHEYKRNTDENGCKLTSQKAAIKAKVPYMTTVAAAKATAEGIHYVKTHKESEIKSLQELHSEIHDK